MSSTLLPSPICIVSSNVLPVPADFSEPAVSTSKDTVVPEDSFGGNVRRTWISNDDFPTRNDGLLALKTNPGAGVFLPKGISIYYLDLAPGFTTPMHRTPTTDFLFVQNGTPTLITPEFPFNILDGEVSDVKTQETLCLEGELVVQRGQMHAWSNKTSSWVRLLGFIVDAMPLRVEIGKRKQTKSLEELWTQWVPR